jgi:hydrocephalus-inducing protein
VSSKIIRCANTSDLESTFQWTLVEDEEAACREAKLADLSYIPINQVFDIRPFRFTLKPRESIPIEISYFGHAGRRFHTTAVCCVLGGPEYAVDLSGEANVAAFRVDKQVLDYGTVVYDATESREFTLMNCGKVEYDFVVDIGTCANFVNALDAQTEALSIPYSALFPKRLQISPSSGRISAGDKAKVIVKLCPGTPDPVLETIRVRIAHFEPIDIKVEAVGVFGSVLLALPRPDGKDDSWRSAITHAVNALTASSLSTALAAPFDRMDNLATVPASGNELDFHIQAEATRLLFRQELALEAQRPPSLSPRGKDAKLSQPMESIVMHSYVLDFGYVIQGFVKKQARIFVCTSKHLCAASISPFICSACMFS